MYAASIIDGGPATLQPMKSTHNQPDQGPKGNLRIATTQPEINQYEINRKSLRSLCEDGIQLDGEHLALKVDVKIDAGQELNAVEKGILWHSTTEKQAAFVREHLL
jgi:hypothetical protein